MKKMTLPFIVLLVAVMASSALADDWQCGSGTGSGGEGLCYVTNVRYYPGATNYVRAKLHDPSGDTTCNYVKFQINTGNSGPQTIENVRAIESVLLTALTTGLPIKFWRLTNYGSSTDCYGGTVFISKPGH